MPNSLIIWWKRDVARNTFVYTNFLIGIPFYLFGTYSVYQIQVTGYMIGTDSDGLPCTTYCIVPFGKSRLDLNSVLLYMNAMTFGIGGFVVLFITAYADYWRHKTLLVTFILVLYGAFTIPAHWLKDYTSSNFSALIGLWVVWGLLTFILMALLNVYIPHCMREKRETSDGNESDRSRSSDTVAEIVSDGKEQRYGFAMSIFGQLASSISGIFMLVIVIILSVTLPADSGQNAGLIVTTVAGFVTLAGSMVSYYGLPNLPTKMLPADYTWAMTFWDITIPFKELLLRKKNMLFLLVAYTIYSDTLFALSSVISQLFYAEIRPSTLEFSIYSIAGPILNFICTAGFFLLQKWTKWNLESCLIIGYVLILIVPLWGCIGLARVDFGYKNRWEFYVQLFINFLSQALVNPTWRMLYSELIPRGEEMMWFGLQVVLSCSTTWVSYIATGPLQSATHDLRFPLILCLIFLLIPVALELCRATMPIFKRDKAWWRREDRNVAQVVESGVVVDQKGFRNPSCA